MFADETIAAIATPPGIGGIGVIRVSGPAAYQVGTSLCQKAIDAGAIQFRRFIAADGDTLDHGLCLYFRGPHSFTGEDCIEIQAHGGPVVLDMLLERVCELGARLARAGEFSERAFLNGRIDLAQAEAIADLIESGSRAASRAAMRSLEGRFSERVHVLVDEVIDLRAFIEAALDFAEEEIDFLDNRQIGERLDNCRQHLDELLAMSEQGRTLREGLSVSLAGLPNAGKSSLLNTLAGYDAAIVTDIEGTTRDVLREHMSLKGIPVRINDTAGLRDAQNPVEAEGIRRAWAEIESADIVVYLVDAQRGISNADREILHKLPADRTRLVYNKADLLEEDSARNPDAMYISARDGDGIEELIEAITDHSVDFNQDHQVFLARRRHVDALRLARDAVLAAGASFAEGAGGELMAEDLRQAQQQLNEITGEFTSDDLLGRIFARFCIGK
ncbi:MAG: tRNA uridine-5-carboxymethylaminomethyl(34) synthesis GTPase MnmE [Gammaproteobacteria bacterium]|nr:tRNA uridine-5-carboxymethylaminomethyl(34) synthesis GTPase MnmE [Gammaproteobacteria bacterium]